jgi:hypothetical protein
MQLGASQTASFIMIHFEEVFYLNFTAIPPQTGWWPPYLPLPAVTGGYSRVARNARGLCFSGQRIVAGAICLGPRRISSKGIDVALGQKQTYALQQVMSALTLKADRCVQTRWRNTLSPPTGTSTPGVGPKLLTACRYWMTPG